MKKLSILFFIFIATHASMFGQQYFVKSYSIESGLPTSIITGACQDKQGYIWFSTYNGISKYDGFTFTNYTKADGLKAPRYRKILCDEKGVIWAIPYIYSESIAFFASGKWYNLPPATKESNNYLTTFDIIYSNNNPIVCIGGYSGVKLYKDNKWQQQSISTTGINNKVYNITAHNGIFFICNSMGICTWKDNSLNWEINKQINPNSKPVYAIKFDKLTGKGTEKMWLLTAQNLGYVLNNKYFEIANNFYLEDVDLVNLTYISQNRMGNIVFGNNFTKYYLNTKQLKITPLKVKNGFTSNGATSVFVDREDNFWITDSRGIDKIKDFSLVNYHLLNGLPENEVTAIGETNDGKIILGHNNEISIFEDNKFQPIEFPKALNALTRVLDIAAAKTGGVWFTANNLGVGKIEMNHSITWYKLPEGQRAVSIYEDTNGIVWVGTNRDLLFIKHGKVEKHKNSSQVGSGVRKIFPSGKGVVISSMRGLWYADMDTTYSLTPYEVEKNNNTFSYLKISDTIELCGTMNGLFQINNGRLIPFQTNGRLISNPVYFISKGKNSTIWIGTNNGVYEWQPNKSLNHITVKNGLAGRETNRSAGFLDSKGNFWVGTDRGLSCFLNSEHTSNAPVPTILMLDFETNEGKTYSLNQDITLSNSNNAFTFHFRGISFSNEELLTYQYKLEGFDKDWKEATQHMLDKIVYNNLTPGKYKLKIKAKNYAGDWSNETTSATIKIKQPYYLSGWFIIVASIVIISVLWFMHLFSRQHMINKALKREIKAKEIAEEELTKSKQQLSYILKGSRLGTWDWNLKTNITSRNEIWSEMLGYSPNEITNTHEFWKSLIHPEDFEKVEYELKRHLTGETTNYEVQYRMLKKDKTYKWILDRATIMERDINGNPLRMSGTHSDIDKRKHDEEALQQSEERIRLILISLPIAIYISPKNSSVDLTLISGNVEKLTGYSNEEFLSTPDFWRTRIHPEDYNQVLSEYATIDNKSNLTLEYRWRVADGTYKWFHDQSIVQTTSTGKEYLGVLVDINERKLYEKEIKTINFELQTTNAEKDKLFSIISHDLRSPVNGFTGLTNLLLEELNNLDKSQIRDIVNSLHNSAIKVHDLVNDLLEWSRLQRGLIEYEPQKVNLHELVAVCISTLSPMAKSKHITIKNLVPEEITVIGDPHMLKAIARNLISNALKFTHQLGEVKIEATSTPDKTLVSVTDSGIGMNKELYSKLFKVNEKTGRRGTEGEPSSGLGLLLCKEFVEKHGGQIGVTSQEGVGSTFYFTIAQLPD